MSDGAAIHASQRCYRRPGCTRRKGNDAVILARLGMPCIVPLPFRPGGSLPRAHSMACRYARARPIQLLALAGSMWLASGCTGSGKFSRPQWLSFGKKEETGPKVVTPRDKMEQLRELAKRGPKMAPDLQEGASNELAQGIAHEQDPILRAQTCARWPAFPRRSPPRFWWPVCTITIAMCASRPARLWASTADSPRARTCRAGRGR